MNLVLLSPHFPPNFYNFAVGARQAEMNVLGIGDAPFETLRLELQAALTEYYRVDDLHNYDSVMRACAYFIHQYGRLDRLESHNEYWLETDARLRTDFNIPGLKLPEIAQIKRKSQMRQIFTDAGVAVARGHLLSDPAAAHDFVAQVGYPLIAKPNIGVGAAGTFKIHNAAELEQFFATRPLVDYLLEEFIVGQLHSFDGLTDQDGRIMFCTAHFYRPGIMEVVNEDLDVFACSLRDIPPGLEEAGRKAVAAFAVRERFFHIEFFQRAADQQWIAVEMNMRPPGGPMLDVFNFANDLNLYEQWANVLAFNAFTASYSRPYHCAFVGRKQHRRHRHSLQDILQVYGHLLIHHEPVTPAFARAMGNYAYLLRSPDLAELLTAIDFILECDLS
ncbi:MAG TPA: ATP-grasp domain-containing protein [Anaerolineae bacterium]|nr:ATP-grasp domain-containing protein [Anaerolineae bacterium]